MPTNDELGRAVPDPTDPADPAAWLRSYSLSHPGIIEVTSRTHAHSVRTAYRAACTARGITPKPLHVWRADTNQMERDVNGTSWEYVAGRQHGATVIFTRPDVADNIVLSLMADRFQRASTGWTLADGANVVMPQAGMYSFSAYLTFSGSASNLGRCFFEFVVNDSIVVGRQSATNEDAISLAMNYPLSAGDKLKVRVYHATGGTRSVTATVQIAMINAPAW